MDAPARFAYPLFFDWGTHQPDGWRTILLTALAYAACVGVSLLLLRYVRRRGRPMLASVSAVVSLIPMGGLGTQSVLLQLTAASHQAEMHVTAVAVTGAAFLGVIGVWVFTRVAPTR
jgi:hypothetical protein